MLHRDLLGGGPLKQLTNGINHGDWSVFIDDTHRSHLISPHVLKNVLAKVVAP